MARYNYDVNKLTRFIDIHKQFMGGLKTVDTDDSLKDVYLREAENVSLSEFNFIEKRYGLHKLNEHKPWTGSLANAESPLQGYFEYYVNQTTIHKIIVIEGRFFVDQGAGAGFQEVGFFDTENGEVYDLTSFGIYLADFVDDATDFVAASQFGTQIPRYYGTDPNGVLSAPVGTIVHTTGGGIYQHAGSQVWNTLATGVPFPFSGAGFVKDTYYYDTSTKKLYQWPNVNAQVGSMTLITAFQNADIQSSRKVEGVRIDDKLYIATGTYPVYYKGDGKIYVMPQYQLSDLDITQRSHNLNSIDSEGDITNANIPEDTSHGSTYNGSSVGAYTITIKDKSWYPRIPYVGSSISFEIAYHLYNSAGGTFWDTNYNSSATNPYGTITGGTPAGAPYTVSPNQPNYTLRPRVYRKAAGVSNTLYQEIPSSKLTFVTLTNDENTTITNTAEFDPLPLTSGASISNMEIEISDVEVGYWDYRIDMIVESTGYWPSFSFTLPTLQTVVLKTKSVEYLNVWVTAENLITSDADYLAAKDIKLHDCNRITEHNGRLCLYGSLNHPDRLFFSDISSKEYFPYFYSLQFTNDLQEGVTSVAKFMNILVVQSPSYTWGITGDSPYPLSDLEGQIYRKITINPTIGCIAPYSVKNVRNQLYFLSKEGIFTLRALFAEDLRYNVDPIDRNIYNIVPRDEDAVCAYFDDQYWLHFPQSGETLRYYVDKKAWVKDIYAAWYNFGGIHHYINESGVLRFITHPSQFESGNDLKIYDVEVDYSLPTDLTKNIQSKFTTSYLNQNYPFHPKNYKEAKFDFAIQNEYNTSLAELPITNYAETINYVEFDVALIDRHFYSITFEPDEIGTRPAAYIVTINSQQVATGNITESNGNLSTIRFMSNITGNATVKITSYAKIITANMSSDSIKLYDSTYDHTVTFNTMVLSEEGTLNIDPIDSYVAADVQVPIDLGTRTGNWTFGTSNFGNVIVAVKTVKLSGRGYNNKVSVIENSKSKWTLESLGITYKMKKARSS